MKKTHKPHRFCIVPQCKNNIKKTPDKVFFPVPIGAKIRKEWCKVIRRNEISPTTCLHCCEDHFNIEEDTQNYVQYNIMKQEGVNVTLRLNKGVLPHIFHCQNRNMPPPVRTLCITMEKDTTNFMRYKLGFSQMILLADEAVPSKFHCQENHKRQLSEPGSSQEVLGKSPQTQKRKRLKKNAIQSVSPDKSDNISVFTHSIRKDVVHDKKDKQLKQIKAESSNYTKENSIVPEYVTIEYSPHTETKVNDPTPGQNIEDNTQFVTHNSNVGQCRCCLTEGEHEGKLDPELFKDFLNLHISTDPRLPLLMCSSCVSYVKEVQAFREMVITSEKNLLQSVNNTVSTQRSNNISSAEALTNILKIEICDDLDSELTWNENMLESNENTVSTPRSTNISAAEVQIDGLKTEICDDLESELTWNENIPEVNENTVSTERSTNISAVEELTYALKTEICDDLDSELTWNKNTPEVNENTVTTEISTNISAAEELTDGLKTEICDDLDSELTLNENIPKVNENTVSTEISTNISAAEVQIDGLKTEICDDLESELTWNENIPEVNENTGREPDSDFGNETENSSTSEEDDNETQYSYAIASQATRPITGQQEEWSSNTFIPLVEPFDDCASGLNIKFENENCTELNIFEYFLDTELVTQIVTHTNQYHNYFMENVPLSTHSRLQKWHNLTVPEFYIFISIIMLMARNKHLTIEDHWSTDPLYVAPVFGSLMPRNRFRSILGMLHFSDPMQSNPNSKLEKIELLVEHASRKYKNLLTPYKNIRVGESMVPFKGTLSIKQCLPNKRNRFNIRLFVLYDVTTGIILDFLVYCGTTNIIADTANLGVGGAVVVTLIQKFFGSYRHLYIDNWYTSPKLLRYLHKNKIYACGTVKPNREGMPSMCQKLKKGEIIAKTNPPLTAIKWNNKKDIHLLSSIHDTKMTLSSKKDQKTGSPVLKPEAVLDYCSNMASVDTSEMMLSSVECIRKSLKWYKKLFLHVVDMHLLNSFYTYKLVKKDTKAPMADFQLNLIRQIIEKYNPQTLIHPLIPSSNANNPLRILPANTVEHMPEMKPHYRNCKECTKRKVRKQTRFMCHICNVYLCASPCFHDYHLK